MIPPVRSLRSQKEFTRQQFHIVSYRHEQPMSLFQITKREKRKREKVKKWGCSFNWVTIVVFYCILLYFIVFYWNPRVLHCCMIVTPDKYTFLLTHKPLWHHKCATTSHDGMPLQSPASERWYSHTDHTDTNHTNTNHTDHARIIVCIW